jgi:hypothetical protein
MGAEYTPDLDQCVLVLDQADERHTFRLDRRPELRTAAVPMPAPELLDDEADRVLAMLSPREVGEVELSNAALALSDGQSPCSRQGQVRMSTRRTGLARHPEHCCSALAPGRRRTSGGVSPRRP